MIFILFLQELCSEYFNTGPLVRDEWILRLDKSIFASLAQMDKLKFWKNIKNCLYLHFDFQTNKISLGLLVRMDKWRSNPKLCNEYGV